MCVLKDINVVIGKTFILETKTIFDGVKAHANPIGNCDKSKTPINSRGAANLFVLFVDSSWSNI